jgi:hypothetical protein
MEVMLLGYEDWQCDWWIAHHRARRENRFVDAGR